MRFSLRVYRLLLKLYPASFREDYHAPLQQQFREELGEVAGLRALALFWGRTLRDFALSMPAQLGREVGQDSRHALRLWRQRPAHTLFAIAVLAIAIGANTRRLQRAQRRAAAIAAVRRARSARRSQELRTAA